MSGQYTAPPEPLAWPDMSITAVVNQKGGVGKTTVALGLTAALAERGAKVLVVDLDPQANASTGLGVWEAATSIDAVLSEDRQGSAANSVVAAGWPEESVRVVPSVIPSSPNLARVEHQLHSDVIGAQDRLATALEGATEGFDEVIIDCPPSLGLLTVNALFAADKVVVVTEPAAWSSDGVDQIVRNVTRIAQRRGGAPEIAGIVVNRLGRTRDAGYWAGELARTHPGLVLETAVRLRAAVAESAAQSMPVSALTRSGAHEAALEFEALAAEVYGPQAAGAATTDQVGGEDAWSPQQAGAEPMIDLSGDMAGVGGFARPGGWGDDRGAGNGL
jgi:chromosome partitioning protein